MGFSDFTGQVGRATAIILGVGVLGHPLAHAQTETGQGHGQTSKPDDLPQEDHRPVVPMPQMQATTNTTGTATLFIDPAAIPTPMFVNIFRASRHG